MHPPDTLPPALNMALKEWDVVVRALSTGRQILLLRKGGILEQSQRNRFAITHDQFLLFPTFLHQSRGELKPEMHDQLLPATSEPAHVTLSAAGVVTDILKVHAREQIDRLDAEHIWTPSLIDMRFNYKPQNPLFLVLVRAVRLPTPITIANTPAYAGCKSWVPLEQPISTAEAIPALSDADFERRRQRVLAGWGD